MAGPPEVSVGDLSDERAVREALAEAVAHLPQAYLEARRWFGGKGRGVRSTRLHSAFLLPTAGPTRYWYVLCSVEYADGQSDLYALPLALVSGETRPGGPSGEKGDVAFALRQGERCVLAFDALLDPEFARALYDLLRAGARLPGQQTGPVRFEHSEVFGEVERTQAGDPRAQVRLLSSEQSNSSVIYGDAFILKLFRRLERGPNPDLEVLRFLTEHTNFRSVPRIAGLIEHEEALPTALAALQTFVPNEGDAWQYALRRLAAAYAQPGGSRDVAPELLSGVERLGEVTGGLHAALAQGEAPDFIPEDITGDDTLRWTSAVQGEVGHTLDLLREVLPGAPEAERAPLQALLGREQEMRDTASALAELADSGAVKTRYHGDYHLGQVLVSTDRFIILDFEGEPARSLAERRAKHTPLRDVAGMLRSLSYAAAASLFALPEAERAEQQPRADAWEAQARARFLDGYRRGAGHSPRRLFPESEETFTRVLRALELEKALYELRYELRNRPSWLRVPLRGITRLLSPGPSPV